MAPKGKAAPKAAASPTPGDQPDPGAQDEPMEDYDMPVIIKVRPEDQLQLTPEELEKEVPPRVLYPANPRAPQNITYFSFKDRAFKRDDQVDQCTFHFSMDGAILLKDSPEAVEQMEIQDKRSEEPRLNSSHITISYAVFCLKKKKNRKIKKKKKHNRQ